MNYYIDTEFLEGTQKKRILGIELPKYFDSKNTIDLISIGIVSSDNREYYAISKDFNLKEAWNRYDLVKDGFRDVGLTPNYKKVYWIRENVLKPIFDEWKLETNSKIVRLGLPISLNEKEFNYKNFKYCIECIGKSNQQIAEEIDKFCSDGFLIGANKNGTDIIKGNPKFYGYFADYDWVVFCWLFGKMIDLPNGFPMYCIDIKQYIDLVAETKRYSKSLSPRTIEECLIEIKNHPNYPKQTNNHHALTDAHWNKQLHDFLNQL